jgi:hypothetical protein
MSEKPRGKLYCVEFERTETAMVYVMAADEADLKAQIADGLSDVLDTEDWFDAGDGETEMFSEADHSRGVRVWSGGSDGGWLPPVERLPVSR